MINLKELEDSLDAALEKETPESLTDWLLKKRLGKQLFFLKQAYRQISIQFPTCTIEYQFSSATLTHFVKVTPLALYNEEAFVYLDIQLTKAFNKQFLEESLCIISEDHLILLDSLLLVYPIT